MQECVIEIRHQSFSFRLDVLRKFKFPKWLSKKIGKATCNLGWQNISQKKFPVKSNIKSQYFHYFVKSRLSAFYFA